MPSIRTIQIRQLLPSVQIIMVTVYEDTERVFTRAALSRCGRARSKFQ